MLRIVRFTGTRWDPVTRRGRLRESEMLGGTEKQTQVSFAVITGDEEQVKAPKGVWCKSGSGLPHRVKEGEQVYQLDPSRGDWVACVGHYRQLPTLEQVITRISSDKWIISGRLVDQKTKEVLMEIARKIT